MCEYTDLQNARVENGIQFEGFRATIQVLMAIEKYTLIQYRKGGFDEWCICYDYNADTREWSNGTYCYSKVGAIRELLRKVSPQDLKSDDETTSNIPYRRMVEIAKVCIDGLFEDDEESASEYLKNEVAISEEEAKWFGIREKLFPKLYKIVEVVFKRLQVSHVKVAMPQDVDSCEAYNYVDALYNLEPDDDDFEWDYDDYDVCEEELEADDVKNKYYDWVWNYEDFEEER